MNRLASTYIVLTCFGVMPACNDLGTEAEHSVAAEPETARVTVVQPRTPIADLKFVQVVKGDTPQLWSLAGGGFYPAMAGETQLAVELELSNQGEAAFEYIGFHREEFPMFKVEKLVEGEWHEIPMGYCGTGTFGGDFLVQPSAKQSVYLPYPRGDEPLRFSIKLNAAEGPPASREVVLEWER